MMHNYEHPAIAATLPVDYDGPDPAGTQPAFHAVVHLLVPGTTEDGRPMTDASAADWISETLRDNFLDWWYDTDHHRPGMREPVTVLSPYIEGSFSYPDDEPVDY